MPQIINTPAAMQLLKQYPDLTQELNPVFQKLAALADNVTSEKGISDALQAIFGSEEGQKLLTKVANKYKKQSQEIIDHCIAAFKEYLNDANCKNKHRYENLRSFSWKWPFVTYQQIQKPWLVSINKILDHYLEVQANKKLLSQKKSKAFPVTNNSYNNAIFTAITALAFAPGAWAQDEKTTAINTIDALSNWQNRIYNERELSPFHVVIMAAIEIVCLEFFVPKFVSKKVLEFWFPKMMGSKLYSALGGMIPTAILYRLIKNNDLPEYIAVILALFMGPLYLKYVLQKTLGTLKDVPAYIGGATAMAPLLMRELDLNIGIKLIIINIGFALVRFEHELEKSKSPSFERLRKRYGELLAPLLPIEQVVLIILLGSESFLKYFELQLDFRMASKYSILTGINQVASSWWPAAKGSFLNIPLPLPLFTITSTAMLETYLNVSPSAPAYLLPFLIMRIIPLLPKQRCLNIEDINKILSDVKLFDRDCITIQIQERSVMFNGAVLIRFKSESKKSNQISVLDGQLYVKIDELHAQIHNFVNNYNVVLVNNKISNIVQDNGEENWYVRLESFEDIDCFNFVLTELFVHFTNEVKFKLKQQAEEQKKIQITQAETKIGVSLGGYFSNKCAVTIENNKIKISLTPIDNFISIKIDEQFYSVHVDSFKEKLAEMQLADEKNSAHINCEASYLFGLEITMPYTDLDIANFKQLMEKAVLYFKRQADEEITKQNAEKQAKAAVDAKRQAEEKSILDKEMINLKVEFNAFRVQNIRLFKKLNELSSEFKDDAVFIAGNSYVKIQLDEFSRITPLLKKNRAQLQNEFNIDAYTIYKTASKDFVALESSMQEAAKQYQKYKTQQQATIIVASEAAEVKPDAGALVDEKQVVLVAAPKPKRKIPFKPAQKKISSKPHAVSVKSAGQLQTDFKATPYRKKDFIFVDHLDAAKNHLIALNQTQIQVIFDDKKFDSFDDVVQMNLTKFNDEIESINMLYHLVSLFRELHARQLHESQLQGVSPDDIGKIRTALVHFCWTMSLANLRTLAISITTIFPETLVNLRKKNLNEFELTPVQQEALVKEFKLAPPDLTGCKGDVKKFGEPEFLKVLGLSQLPNRKQCNIQSRQFMQKWLVPKARQFLDLIREIEKNLKVKLSLKLREDLIENRGRKVKSVEESFKEFDLYKNNILYKNCIDALRVMTLFFREIWRYRSVHPTYQQFFDEIKVLRDITAHKAEPAEVESLLAVYELLREPVVSKVYTVGGSAGAPAVSAAGISKPAAALLRVSPNQPMIAAGGLAGAAADGKNAEVLPGFNLSLY